MGEAANEADVMENSKSAVLRESESLEDAFPAIRGYDFNQGVNYREILKSFGSTGFQAANLWDAIEIVNQMINWRLSHEQLTEDCSEEEKNPTYRESVKCKIFLGFSSNHISSGVRDDILYLVEHHMVEVIVTEAGAIVEDIIKCLADKYCKFEDWIKPIFEIMLEEQNTKVPWTPSKVIARLGKEINNESSYLYWAYKNDIPVFCPGLFTDPIGQMLDRHCNPGFILDIKKDITRMNNEAVHANLRKTGMIILGGGSPKHHICNANMMRNGADYSVFINTAEEFDGSDSGARPDEAVSWGKIRASAKSVKVHCDATIAFPLLVAETFAASKSPRTKVHDDATIASPSLAKETFVASISQRAQQARLAATGEATKESKVIENARSVVFKESESLEDTCAKIHGYDFNKGVNYSEILKSLVSTGFQASNLGDAIETVNHMLDGRLSNAPVTKDCNKQKKNPTYKESGKCKIFLGFTSNLISSGVRDTIRYLAEHRMVDVIVTTAGGIEEDIIKCLADTYKGDFSLPGAALRSKGLNRIGNLLVPNENYCKFEDWIMPVLDGMLEEQNTEHVLWSPSKIIARLGKEINNKSSYLYWAYKNNIPVFCPALTDGSLGDMLYFHSYRNPDLLVDIMQDIKAMYSEAMHANARKTGMLILGGGLPKHHICNVNMMHDGADYAVFINTAHEFDGTDSGEAVSRDKICKFVKVHCDATIAFPLLVAETFAARRRANTSGFVYYSCLLLVMFACLLCLWFIIT